ncbi:hypothetical protein WG66_005078 [Moniliophthora roreri]|nr:hypothetical protein WG66_005078 [Moniliophthora roreri]
MKGRFETVQNTYFLNDSFANWAPLPSEDEENGYDEDPYPDLDNVLLVRIDNNNSCAVAASLKQVIAIITLHLSFSIGITPTSRSYTQGTIHPISRYHTEEEEDVLPYIIEQMPVNPPGNCSYHMQALIMALLLSCELAQFAIFSKKAQIRSRKWGGGFQTPEMKSEKVAESGEQFGDFLMTLVASMLSSSDDLEGTRERELLRWLRVWVSLRMRADIMRKVGFHRELEVLDEEYLSYWHAMKSQKRIGITERLPYQFRIILNSPLE